MDTNNIDNLTLDLNKFYPQSPSADELFEMTEPTFGYAC